MRKFAFAFLLAGSVFAGELLKEGELLTGFEVGQRSEPVPLLISLKGSSCTVYAVAVSGDAGRVWIRPEKLYCGEKKEKVKGFVTDERGVLGIKCGSVPCLLEKGTKVKVFLEREDTRRTLETTTEKLLREWKKLLDESEG